MKKYPKYFPTKIEWIGDVPENWSLKTLRRITKEHRQGYYTEKPYIQEGVKLVRITDLHSDGSIDYSDMPFVEISETSEKLYRVLDGDFLFPRTGTIGSLGFVSNPERAVFASYLIRFRFKPSEILNGFLYYYFMSNAFLDGVFSDLHGGVVQNIHAENIKNQFIAHPKKIDEQQIIVSFLDYKTGQIDRFITNRKKQIELLKEQKQCVLEKRITEGINPERGFQKIENLYIEQIPIGWEFKKLAFLSKITRLAGYEYTLHWEPKDDGEVIALRGQNVGFNEFKEIENAERISIELSLKLNRSKLYKGDIVFPCVGTVGKAVLIEEDNKYHINQNIAKITPKNDVDGLFLTLLLNSYYAYHQIIHFNTSDAQPNVLVRDLRRFMIPTPPYEEQKKIAMVIMKELNSLNALISKYQKQIDLMQEYRTSLISQAVTGKIDVREWQPKNNKVE